MQTLVETNGNYSALDLWFLENSIKCVLLVCSKSICRQKIGRYFQLLTERLGVRVVYFTDFQPNPLYKNVLSGVHLFRNQNCDSIIAVGGGSAIDVAKCVKLFNNMNGNGADGEFLKQTIVKNSIPFLAMPTTAGTGSESTRFAVVYLGGIKQTVSDISCIPNTVLLDAGVLKTLPDYQRKATMLDALCHGIESYWSVNSTEESRLFSRTAIQGIMENMEKYLANNDSGNRGMLLAANMAGKAINLAQTTAGHAMCYKITSLFGCAHGHAAALCNRVLFPWMIENIDKCTDPRGEKHLELILDEIGVAMGCRDAIKGAERLTTIIHSFELLIPAATKAQFMELKTSVNHDRLINHPIMLNEDIIDTLYHRILNHSYER